MPIDPIKLEKAKELRASGMGIGPAAVAAGISHHLFRCHLDPDYRRRRAIYERNKRRKHNDRQPWRQKYKDEGKKVHTVDRERTVVVVVPNDILYERDRRLALAPRDLTSAILGDPKPGFSALDKKQKVFG